MSKLIGRLLVVLAFAWVGSASAVPLTYILEGDLDLVNSLDYYQLDGARFIWTIETDTSYPSPDSPGSNQTTASFLDWDTSFMVITNRPSAAPDIHSPVRKRVSGIYGSSAYNYYTASSQSYDTYNFASANMDEFIWLDWTGPEFFYPINHWVDGEVPTLPTDFSDVYDSRWKDWDAQPQRPSRYRPINWSITAQVESVPTPSPATIPLLGAALAGLGWSRRNNRKETS